MKRRYTSIGNTNFKSVMSNLYLKFRKLNTTQNYSYYILLKIFLHLLQRFTCWRDPERKQPRPRIPCKFPYRCRSPTCPRQTCSLHILLFCFSCMIFLIALKNIGQDNKYYVPTLCCQYCFRTQILFYCGLWHVLG